VAKIASDLQKPDGLVIVEPGTVEQFLAPLEISRLWGVGEKTRPHLEKMGIKTIGDITQFSCEEMTKRFGKHGRHLWNLAHGRDDREVVSYTKVKSVSNEVTFEHDTAEFELMQKTILQLSEKVAGRLRKKQLMGNTVTLKIRLEGFTTFTRNRTLKEPVNTSEGIYSAAFALFKKFDRSGKKVRLLGVGVSALKTDKNAQMSLFEEQKQDESKIDTVMDEIRDKFGDKSIFRASLLRRKLDPNE
jgi:DNA polymerase-4